MALAAADCLKCTAFVGVVVVLEIAYIHSLDWGSPTFKKERQETTARTTVAAFDLDVPDKCYEKKEDNLIASYTLPGKSFLPVLIITCSTSNNPTFVPTRFFKQHAQQNPILRLGNAEQGSKYAVVLTASSRNDTVRWVVINVEGAELKHGVRDWKKPDYHVLVEYNPTVESSTNVYYRFLVFKQRGKFGFRGSSESVARVLKKLVAANMLTAVAAASFHVGEK